MLAINRITEILQDSGLSWLLPNLRQDIVVWNTLVNTSFIEKVVQSKPVGEAFLPADFSPIRLALLALDQSDPSRVGSQIPQDSIDENAAIMAMRKIHDSTLPQLNSHDLASAGLMALTLFNQYDAAKSWDGVLNTLQSDPRQQWMTPIACLYGLLDDSTELLRALIQPGASPLQHHLAVHAVLSNPIPAHEQRSLLFKLCHTAGGNLLPTSNRLLLLQACHEQCPQAALDFSSMWLDARPNFTHQADLNHINPVEQINLLQECLYQVEVRRIAEITDELPDLLEYQLSLTQNLYTGLLNNYLLHKASNQNENPSFQEIPEIYDKAIKLIELNRSSNNCPASQAELALTLASRGLFEEANILLPAMEDALPDDQDNLFAIAKVSFLVGNTKYAWEAASRLTELINLNGVSYETKVWGDGFSLVNLSRLLIDLHKPSEALHTLEHALQICPNDIVLLKLLADSYKSASMNQKVAETLNILVSLEPSVLDYRRAFAQSLEDLGDWETSLKERSRIIGSNDGNTDPPSLNDKYAYAHCAIGANKPELTLQICAEILAQNQEDDQALIYSGKAYLLLEDHAKGMEFLSRATQIAPHLSDAWLALAEAQGKIYPPKTVIETLKNASLSVPGSPKIHFALGDLYLQDDESTLAQLELKSAVDLSPNNPQFLLRYGEALKALGHINECREILTNAYRLEPGFPGLAQMYANILLDLGDLEAAISPLETIINSNALHDPAPYLDYARCVLSLNKRGSTMHSPMKALIALNEVLQNNPKHAEAKALSAEALSANGENELAFQAYREVLDTSLIENSDWFERLSFGFGCVAASIGKNDIAIAALQEAGQANPNNPAIFMALSNVYIAANLPEDAMRTARNVLVIDGDDPDNLAWFANQAVKICGNKKPEIFNSIATVAKEVNAEALIALNKAIQIAPTRSDLLVQLGKFQTSIGATAEAQATFASIASHDFATVDDLVSASNYLSQIEDHTSAIACLEKGILIARNANSGHDPALYARLAQEYVINHDHKSAINTLDQAIERIPDDSGLIASKVDILLGLGQPLDALNAIETALQKSIGGRSRMDLQLLASQINRTIGDFSAAINYAIKAASSSNKENSGNISPHLPIRHRTQIAEIYRALLQPEHAYQILQGETYHIKSTANVEQDYLDFILLHTELALETGQRLCPDIQDVKLEATHPSFSRLMAINARLMNKAGNHKQSEQLYQLALNRSVNKDNAGLSSWTAPYNNYLNLVSMIEAAQDLGLWDHAMTFAKQMVETSAGEPLTHLNFARTIVRKAEFNYLCEVFEVTKHKPSIEVQPEETYNLCKQYLNHSRAQLEPWFGQNIASGYEIITDEINRWQARAEVIFTNKNQASPGPTEILSRHHTPDDTVAVIHNLQLCAPTAADDDTLSRMIKLAQSYPRNPSVILKLALVLEDSNPLEAMKSLQSVLDHNPYAKNPSIAFSNLLLARIGLNQKEYGIAKDAVENALSFWPDEPNWNRLAAHIYTQTHDINNSIDHFEEAIRLAPENITCHMELGLLLFESANDDTSKLNLALTCFENALTLDPKNVTALINLAHTHYQLRDLVNAESLARNALNQVPDKTDLYILLGEIALEKKDFKAALDYASEAIRRSPKDIQSTILAARSLSAMGKHDEALSMLNAVVPLVHEAKSLHLERVNIIRKVNGPQIALNELKSLSTTYPDDFDVLHALSKSLYEVGELENSVAVAQQALKVGTNNTSVNEQANLHLLIGQVLRQSGQLDQSIQHLADSIQLAPNRLEPYLELGLARKERREYDKAIQVFERATKIAPNDPRAPFQAGLALKESKDYKSSETMLRLAVSLAPNDLTIRRQLAAVVALNLIHNPRSARVNA